MANVLWVTFLIVLFHEGHSQTCTNQTNCKCNGTDPTTSKSVKFDISTLFSPYPITVDGGNTSTWNYIYNPCSVMTCGTATPNQANVCQQSKTSTTQYNAGLSPKWTIVNSTSFTIAYSATTGGITRSTTVTFVGVAGLSAATTTTATETGTGKYVFTVYMPISGGGGGGGDASGYVGFILISLMLAALVAYFVAGAIIMYAVKGARGIEIIPNIGFWKDLPFLIKDGVMFMLSPCLQKCRGGGGGYTKM